MGMDGLDKKTEVILEQEKLSSMKEMMDNIAHQWRQPLSQINSIISVIDNRLYELSLEDDFINKKLEEIENLTKYMSNTIDDFRGYFGEESQKCEFVIASVIEEALTLFKPYLEEEYIELVFLNQSNSTLFTYKNELKQMVMVLLNNAKDVLINRNIHKAKIVVELLEDEQYIEIRVIDNGGGISKSIKNKIFEPYYTTKHKSQGTGLGLYMSRNIVQNRLDGDLSAQNYKEGACFSIKFKKDNQSAKI